MGAAALTFVAMMFSWSQLPAVNPDGTPGKGSLFDEMLKAFIIGVTIVVRHQELHARAVVWS